MHSFLIISVVLILALRVVAQTTADPFNSVLSVAFSVYTEVTSILASDASNAAPSTSSISSSTSTSSLSSATTTSSSLTIAASTSSTTNSNRPSPTSATPATASTSAAAHSGGGLSSTNLAIILGCVLGALALGLLLLVLILCCRRRRRSGNGSSRSLSPDGEEIDSWRNHKNRPRSRDGLIGGNNYHDYRNEKTGMPNVVEHPASTNSHSHRNPFVPVPPAPRRSAQNSRASPGDITVPGQDPYTGNSNGIDKDHHHGGELAAGAAGAAVGAAALHHHEKNKYDNTKHQSNNNYNDTHDEKPMFARRLVPANAYPTTTSNDDAYALNKFPSRKSGEAAHPYDGDDFGYGTGPYEAGQRGIRQPNTSTPLSPFNGAGHHRGSSSDNGHPLMAAGAGALGGAALANHHNRNRSGSTTRHSYNSAKTLGPNAPFDHNRPPMPPPPIQAGDTHPARDLVSPISSDSYSSATGNSGGNNTLSSSTARNNNHHIPSELPSEVPTRPASFSPRHSFGANNQQRPRSHSGSAPAAAALAHRRDQTPPNLPGRSPKRTPFSNTNTDQAYTARNSDSQPSSDDSTWRLSSGMPGGWARNPSREQRRDSSPAANSDHLRKSGINLLGRAESPARHSMPVGNGSGRRLRLADLKREEEERMEVERRGRQSMGSEWSGNGGYDEHGRAQGVGQAM